MNKLFKIFSKYKLLILILFIFVLILTVGRLTSGEYSKYYLYAKFNDSGPLYKNMPVYYKGCLLGQTKKIKISSDYKFSLLKIEFYPKSPILYDNIVAKAKKLEIEDDYIDLVYTDSPSNTLLKRGGVIEGKGAFDMDSILSEVVDADVVIPLFQDLSDALGSINQTSTEVRKFFSDSRSTLKESRQNLKQTSKNLAITTQSLVTMTSRLNHYITDNKLKNTTSNIDKSSDNIVAATESIKNITTNIDCATRNLDKTMTKIDSTASDVNIITNGFCQILHKRFAGLRILFGKVISNNACQKNCSR